MGVRSVPVVAITGMFIGMVMAVQFYEQFNHMGLATRLGRRRAVGSSTIRQPAYEPAIRPHPRPSDNWVMP